MGVAESDFERDLAYTKDLIGPLATDQQHADHNQRVFGEWLSRWVPVSIAAARALEPLWSEPEQQMGTGITEKMTDRVKKAASELKGNDSSGRGGRSFEQAFGRVKDRVRGILGELNIASPKDLDQ